MPDSTIGCGGGGLYGGSQTPAARKAVSHAGDCGGGGGWGGEGAGAGRARDGSVTRWRRRQGWGRRQGVVGPRRLCTRRAAGSSSAASGGATVVAVASGWLPGAMVGGGPRRRRVRRPRPEPAVVST